MNENSPEYVPADERRNSVLAIVFAQVERLWLRIKAYPWTFGGTIALFLMMGVIYLHITPKMYQASISIASTIQGADKSLLGSGGTSGLAALAGGLGLSQEEYVSPFLQFTNSLGSVDFARRLQARDHALQHIYASKWDAEHQRWVLNTGLRGELRVAIAAVLNRNAWREPSEYDLADYVSANVLLNKIGATGIYSITYQDSDPAFARQFLRDIVAELDATIRAQDLQRIDRNLAYLNARVNQVENHDVKTMLAASIVQQEQQRMLTNSGLPYAARLLSTVNISDTPVSPSATSVIGLSLLFGLFCGWLALVVREQFAKYLAVRRERRLQSLSHLHASEAGRRT